MKQKKLFLILLLFIFLNTLLIADVVINGKFILDNGGQAHISGSWNNNGDFIANDGTVRFFGSTPSSIYNISEDIFFELIIDKSATMQLVNDIKITEGLFLENGLLSGISSVRLNNENTTNSNDIFKR